MEAIGAISNIAGVLSAGIQVCEGLVNYYNAWKGSKKENADMIKSIENLSTNFVLLKVTLQSPTFDKVMAKTVESKVLDCEDSITELQDELKKVMICKPSVVDTNNLLATNSHDNNGFRDRMTEQGRRILYPFRKSTLMRLQENIEHMRSNLVLAMDILNLSTASTTAGRVADISKQVTTISSGLDAIITQQMDKESIQVLEWLSTIDCHSKQREMLSRRHEGTGEWLFESQKYQNWLDGKDRLLWCSGSPGAGKTVLASAIVDNLETTFSSSNVGVAFVYCNYAEKTTIAEYLASIVQQLVRQRYVIPDYVIDLYRKHRSMGRNLTSAEAVHLLHLLTSEFPRLYIVVDGLDECDETKKTRSNLVRELRNLPLNTNVLLTSRRLGDIEDKLSDCPHLEIRASDHDVRAYLGARIDTDENILKFCKKDPTLRETIVGKIAEKAHGMFLLAHLHIEAIASELKISRIKKALAGLPNILDNSYDDAMKRIMEGQDTNRKNLAMNILMWLSCAKRLLTLRELQHAMAIMELDPDEDELDEEDFYDQDLLLTVCAGLVVIDPESGIIRLCHYTLQEYFERHRSKFFADADILITRACIRYSSLDDFKKPENPDRGVTKIQLRRYSLLSYASQYLCANAQGTAEIELTDDIPYFLNQGILVNGASAAMKVSSIRNTIEFSPSIVAAVMFGLPTIIGKILKSEADIEATCSKDFTPLLMAAEMGHLSVVSGVVASKAEFLAKDYRGDNSLHEAPLGGYTEIVKQLVSAEPSLIEVALEDNFDKTALHMAIGCNYEEVIRALIGTGVDVNRLDGLKLALLMNQSWQPSRNRGNLPETVAAFQKPSIY
ncbi:4a4361a0-46ea-4436-a941-eb14bdffe16c [Sclerotinia trifoliorum]|uniref:4a4361a0-46ea-4436-a941-eb14bdffe16c n=1 Tax=Sclerotinia trifoliorum TaxID=28548 RepID=A0A8H2VWA4_9HELO|nr:4a4361a0-46ea-4436-a941-eb14bdffe16c [Sclerotinia trifoliorum]